MHECKCNFVGCRRWWQVILKKIGYRFVTMNKTFLMLGPVLVATFYRCSTKEVFIKVLQSLQKTTLQLATLSKTQMFLCKFNEIFKNAFFFWITFRDCFGFWYFVNLVWLTLKIQYVLMIWLRFIIFWFWWLMINGYVFMSTKYGWWLVVLDNGNNVSVKLWQLSNYYCWWEVAHIGESKRNGCKSSS